MPKIREFYNVLSSAILSGICISIGCVTYLKVGGVAGAILFAFGLLTVVHYKWGLYTGRSGFVYDWRGFKELIIVFLGNLIGCFIMSAMMRYSYPALIESSVSVVEARFELGIVGCGLMSIMCGFIMTTAVMFAKEKLFLPLLFGVPVFILCGFLHSIADAFYFLMTPCQFMGENLSILLKTYGIIVLGNFIGCNLVRIIKLQKYYD